MGSCCQRWYRFCSSDVRENGDDNHHDNAPGFEEHIMMEPCRPSETKMDMIEEKFKRLKPGQKAVILFTTGSMNPIHVGHVRQLEVAAQYFATQRFENSRRTFEPKR